MVTIKEFDSFASCVKKRRNMSVREALQSDQPLLNIFHNIGNDSIEQKIFNMIYRVILDVNSTCIYGLFERYEPDEIEKVVEYLEYIHAEKTREAVIQAQNAISEIFGKEYDFDNILNILETESIHKLVCKLDKRYENFAEEMEQRLFTFAQNNIDSLDAELYEFSSEKLIEGAEEAETELNIFVQRIEDEHRIEIILKIKSLLNNNDRIGAIRLCRKEFDCSVNEAKAFVDKISI